MVDSKAAQKPERFSGKDADWASCAYKFTTWLETQQEGAEVVLEWAASQVSDVISRRAVDESVVEPGELEEHARATRDTNKNLHLMFYYPILTF